MITLDISSVYYTDPQGIMTFVCNALKEEKISQMFIIPIQIELLFESIYVVGFCIREVN